MEALIFCDRYEVFFLSFCVSLANDKPTDISLVASYATYRAVVALSNGNTLKELSTKAGDSWKAVKRPTVRSLAGADENQKSTAPLPGLNSKLPRFILSEYSAPIEGAVGVMLTAALGSLNF